MILINTTITMKVIGKEKNMNKEQDGLLLLVETIVDSTLDLKNQGMNDQMIKDMMIALAGISLKEYDDKKEMFN